MLLVHQTGSVRVGELVRYTLTYTPARDRVHPLPSHLYIRVRNTCNLALRAAYLHGPYTLYTACYPDTFNPNTRYDFERYGEPQFEPMLKAGGSWSARLKIPETLREDCEVPSSSGDSPESCTWIIECTSQVLFSTSAQVHYEIIVSRDEKSFDVGFAGLSSSATSAPGRLIDHQEIRKRKSHEKVGPMKGVFSSAVTLLVEDTATLWDKPRLPGLEHSMFHEFKMQHGRTVPYPNEVTKTVENSSNDNSRQVTDARKRRVHLVVVTHGLHSNLGADMLYLKESIDAAAKQARMDARVRRKASLTRMKSHPIHDYMEDAPKAPDVEAAEQPATSTAPLSGGQEDLETNVEDEEEVIVRGFSGNAIRTERGIQYLGKRLAKYVLGMTYPDQPFLPVKKSLKKSLSRTFAGKDKSDGESGHEAHHNSSVRYGGGAFPLLDRPYQITSISFIGHSLGGLTQMYAIAYIHKHSPEFFHRIQPVNFITLASPLLGLSNENPMYVRFALDFGLVGRTGQDLGLTWRAPTIARSGWAGMIAGIGTEKQRAPKRLDPGTKPLLRLLPSGPAHQALKMFRNRTVYSNVINDGIVPLRTSCLLFLDWRGLGRVEKARRENGLIGTMAGWGWAELTGINSTEHRNRWPWQNKSQQLDETEDSDVDSDEGSLGHNGDTVPQPSDDATSADYTGSSPEPKVRKETDRKFHGSISPTRKPKVKSTQDEVTSPLAGFMSLFGASSPKKPKQEQAGRKAVKAIKRAQTIKFEDDRDSERSSTTASPEPSSTASPTYDKKASAGDADQVFAPPKTSVFEAAGDLLNPPLPTLDFIIDPQSRPRTIFHDRVYHPEDIPPPPVRRKSTFRNKRTPTGSIDAGRRDSERDPSSATAVSSPALAAPSSAKDTVFQEVGNMPVEEKIARAYHRDLSWRKVLVRLSPDAHNNMVVRRMFANAHGWPVIKHLVDTHFADTVAALTADSKETNVERARPMDEAANPAGDEVKNQRSRMTGSMHGDDERQALGEDADIVGDLKTPEETVGALASHGSYGKLKGGPDMERQDSVSSTAWTDRFLEATDEDTTEDEHEEISLANATTTHQLPSRREHARSGQGPESDKETDEVDANHHEHSSLLKEDIKTKANDGDRGGSSLVLPVERIVKIPETLSPTVGLGLSIDKAK